MVGQLDGTRMVKVAEAIDRLVYDEALALFLCAPRALYAVNKRVKFAPYRTTFELAETEVDEQHWSRRGKAGPSPAAGAAVPPSLKGLSGFSGGASPHAC